MRKAAAILTSKGGRGCHAAIVARQLGIPTVVGCGTAMGILQQGEIITVSCAEGEDGCIYPGYIPHIKTGIGLSAMPPIRTKLMLHTRNFPNTFQFTKSSNQANTKIYKVHHQVNTVSYCIFTSTIKQHYRVSRGIV